MITKLYNLYQQYLPLFVGILVTTGIIARIYLFILNPTLWLDEAALTLNVLDFDLIHLIQTDRLSQSAPFGYMLLQKLITSYIGINEYLLRIPTFLAGLLSLYLIYLLLKEFDIKNKLVLGFYALLPVTIMYSVQDKQYMVELACTTAILLFTKRYINDSSAKNWRNLLIIGAISLIFSQTSIFILAASGFTVLFQLIFAKKQPIINIVKQFLFPALLWGGIFSILYLIQYRYTSGNMQLHNYWVNTGAFLKFTDIGTFKQVFRSLFSFNNSFGRYSLLGFIVIPTLSYLSTFAFNKSFLLHRKIDYILILSCFIFSFIASLLGIYPLAERLTIYLIPASLLLLSLLLHHENHILPKILVNALLLGQIALFIYTLRQFPLRYLVVGDVYGFQQNLTTLKEYPSTKYNVYFFEGRPTIQYYERMHPYLSDYKPEQIDGSNPDWQRQLDARLNGVDGKKTVFLFPLKVGEWEKQIQYLQDSGKVRCESKGHFMCVSN